MAQVLASSTAAPTLAQITACFAASASLKQSLPTRLQTQQALGRAQPTQVDACHRLAGVTRIF